MPDKPLPREKILTILAATPQRLAELIIDRAPEQFNTAPAPGEWSANDVLAHLRACADLWGKYIREILTHDRPAIRAVSPRTWINQTDYHEQEFRASLHAFTTQRTELLAVLEPLAPTDWEQVAIVQGVGAPIERTVLNYADRLAHHERPHITQIERIVNLPYL